MTRSIFYCCTLTVALLLSLVSAQEEARKTAGQSYSATSPVGRWKTVDDATGKVKSVVVIWEEKGKLYGQIEKLIDPDPQDPNPRCTHCQGEMKDKPVVGLRILWDLSKDGNQWSGGKVLDPDNGKVYKCSVAVEDGGKKLKLRGFIGISLLGRTQVWVRDE
jgi:uncharacterized protein (DUF2147 family)